ncbi:unnamed protein product, partial [Ilex paraguariensis]
MTPSTSSLDMVFTLLLAFAIRWKNFVFLSPSLNHVILDFCRQLIFSVYLFGASLLHSSLADTLRAIYADDRGLDSFVRS